MPIGKINDSFCFLGTHNDSQSYWDCDENLYTWGYCPLCNELLICDFTGYAPDWIFNGKPDTGTFEVLVVPDSYYNCPQKCFFYRHRFIVSYTGFDTHTTDYVAINFKLNLVVPFHSSDTKKILEQFTSIISPQNVTVLHGPIKPNQKTIHYFKQLLSWDNPMKCEFFARFSSKTCKDIALCIASYIDWLCPSEPVEVDELDELS